MSDLPSAPSTPKPARDNPDPADPALVAKLQQAANAANENCDRAMALAHKLSGQLREAQARINELEIEADGLVDGLRKETEAALGAKFEQKKFHDFILSQGLLPPDLMRKAVLEDFVPSQK